MDVTRLVEIEHKFIVPPTFDVAGFEAALARCGPSRRLAVDVVDRYFLTRDGQAHAYLLRHRFDATLHHLTLKSFGDDTEVRDEINLDLGHHAGAQTALVDAFVARMGVVWSVTVAKSIVVWHFDDCEVVHYRATGGDRTVHCVEFEAVDTRTPAAALATIARYEAATGFDPSTRTAEPLLSLLYPDLLPGHRTPGETG